MTIADISAVLLQAHNRIKSHPTNHVQRIKWGPAIIDKVNALLPGSSLMTSDLLVVLNTAENRGTYNHQLLYPCFDTTIQAFYAPINCMLHLPQPWGRWGVCPTDFVLCPLYGAKY